MSNPKTLNFLGLATKAGKVCSGEDTVERMVKSMKARLVIVAEDASDNTRKKFTDICSYREVPMRFFAQKDELGRHTGKEFRAVVAILDDGFARRLVELIDACADSV